MRETFVPAVPASQRRPAGGGNTAGRYGGRTYLREYPIMPGDKLHQSRLLLQGCANVHMDLVIAGGR